MGCMLDVGKYLRMYIGSRPIHPGSGFHPSIPIWGPIGTTNTRVGTMWMWMYVHSADRRGEPVPGNASIVDFQSPQLPVSPAALASIR